MNYSGKNETTSKNVADEELIEGMSSAMAAESERATKFNVTARGKPTLKALKIEMLATLKAIQTELALKTVQTEVATLRTKVDQTDSTTKGCQ